MGRDFAWGAQSLDANAGGGTEGPAFADEKSDSIACGCQNHRWLRPSAGTEQPGAVVSLGFRVWGLWSTRGGYLLPRNELAPRLA